MKPQKKREIRNLLRQASQRAHGEEPAPPPAPAAPAVYEMTCMCGRILRLTEAVDELRCACPSCKRKFQACFALDPATGQKSLSPLYIDDGITTGDTFVPDFPDVDPSKGVFDDALDPPPPPHMLFPCPQCSRKILAKQEAYDKRVRCPDCSMRMLINVIYDPARKIHEVHPVRVEEKPSGDTWLLDR